MGLLVGGLERCWRNRSTSVAVAAVALIAGVLGLVASPAAAAPGALSGTVTSSATGQPLPSVEVRAYSASYGVLYGTATTDLWGNYSVSLPAGSYRLRYDDPSGAHHRVYSGGSPTWAGSATVSVPSNATLVYPMAMTPTATLGGTITNAATSAGATGIVVAVLDPFWGVTLTDTTTGAGGTYTLPLDPGTYRLRFSDPTGSLATTYSGGTYAWATSSTVSTTQAGPNTVDLALAPKPTLSGTVTNTSAAPLAGIAVEVLGLDNWPVATTTTDAAGHYSTTVNPGTYKIRYIDHTGTYATQYTGNGATPSTSGTITLATDTTADITLPIAGSLTGTSGYASPFGPQGVAAYVGAFEATTFALVGLTVADSSGAWAINGLPPGSYKVAFVSPELVAGHPEDGFRPIVLPDHDVQTEGVVPALTNGQALTVTGGATTAASGHVRGWDCSPDRMQPWAVTPPVTPLDLSGQDLSHQNLAGCSLIGADLSGADLSGANLSFTYLWFADLSGADLTESTLDGALLEFGSAVDPPFGFTDMHGTTIAGASFRGAYVSLDYSLVGAAPDWHDTDFTDAKSFWFDFTAGNGWVVTPFEFPFIDIDTMEGHSFGPHVGSITSAGPFDLRGSTITDGAMVGDLDGSDVSGLICRDCTFMTWSFEGVGPIDASGANLAGADLSGSAFTAGSNLSNANLLGVTGNPSGGSTATYSTTTCPNGQVTDGTTITTCVGRGLGA